MLIVSRAKDETIVLEVEGRTVTVMITKIHGANRVSIGITAPKEVVITRGELKEAA